VADEFPHRFNHGRGGRLIWADEKTDGEVVTVAGVRAVGTGPHQQTTPLKDGAVQRHTRGVGEVPPAALFHVRALDASHDRCRIAFDVEPGVMNGDSPQLGDVAWLGPEGQGVSGLVWA
jgi:hypothetical protein